MKTGAEKNRGIDKGKSEEELRQEAQAKGHKPLPEESETINEITDEREPDSSEKNKERGHQKGFGRNQGKEGEYRSAPHGTRAEGAEHG